MDPASVRAAPYWVQAWDSAEAGLVTPCCWARASGSVSVEVESFQAIPGLVLEYRHRC
jgi:hypothetical protein